MPAQTIIDFIGNLTHSAGPAAGQPFILREAAQMIVEAAEAGLIQIGEATDLLRQLSRHTSERHLFG